MRVVRCAERRERPARFHAVPCRWNLLLLSLRESLGIRKLASDQPDIRSFSSQALARTEYSPALPQTWKIATAWPLSQSRH